MGIVLKGLRAAELFFKASIWPLLFFLLFLVSGCRLAAIPTGEFQASMLERVGGVLKESLVRVDIEVLRGSSQATVTVRELSGAELFTLGIRANKKTHVEVEIPVNLLARIDELSLPDGVMRLEEESGCYVSRLEKRAQLCFSKNRFLLEVTRSDQVPIFSLSADRFKKEPALELEEAKKYRLVDLVGMAFEKNFESRIQYEHLLQAKSKTRAAYLNLLPHLSFSTALSVGTAAAQGMYASAGDLAPFLFPTRWFQAKEAALKSQAERDALLIMQADLAATVEGMNYVYERDKAILATYDLTIEKGKAVKEQLAQLEKAGKVPEGSADDIETLVNSMLLDRATLIAAQRIQRHGLAQALGFQNPEAVLDVELGEEIECLDDAKPVDSEAVSRLALSRSYELRQMDSLIDIAKWQKRELYFNWLDPTGDPGAGLGLALRDLVVVSKSKVKELQLRRAQLRAGLVQKVFETVATHDGVIKSNEPMKKHIALQEKRLDRIIKQIQPGANLNSIELSSIFQDYLTAKVRGESLRATYRIARSKLDRFLLKGYYQSRRPKIMDLWKALVEWGTVGLQPGS